MSRIFSTYITEVTSTYSTTGSGKTYRVPNSEAFYDAGTDVEDIPDWYTQIFRYTQVEVARDNETLKSIKLKLTLVYRDYWDRLISNDEYSDNTSIQFKTARGTKLYSQLESADRYYIGDIQDTGDIMYLNVPFFLDVTDALYDRENGVYKYNGEANKSSGTIYINALLSRWIGLPNGVDNPTQSQLQCFKYAKHTDSTLEFRPQLIFEFEENNPAPTIVSPANGSVMELVANDDGQIEIPMAWVHKSTNNLSQKAYQIQIKSINSNQTAATSVVESSQMEDVLTITNLDWYRGNVSLSVRTQDTGGTWSTYAESIYYLGEPLLAPTVTTATFGEAKPRVEWEYEGEQIAYKIKIKDADGDILVDATVESSEHFFDVPIILESEQYYTVEVAVCNETLYFSQFVSEQIFADYDEPEVPVFVTAKKKTAVGFTITNFDSSTVYRLYRNNLLVKDNIKKVYFEDIYCPSGVNVYMISASKNDLTVFSEEAEVEIDISEPQLIFIETGEIFPIKYNFSLGQKHEYEPELLAVEGKVLPKSYYNSAIAQLFSIECSFKSLDKVFELQKLLDTKNVVFFRYRHIALFCSPISFSFAKNNESRSYDVSLELNGVDWEVK